MINTVNDYTYNQLGNMAKTNALTPRTSVSRLNHEEIESVHIQIMSNVIETVIKIISSERCSETDNESY